MLRRLIIMMFMAVLAGPAAAQQIITLPAMGSSATDAQDQSGDQADQQDQQDQQAQNFHILVVGDALGGGLGAGLSRAVADEAGYDVTLRFNEFSGIARPELYDWSTTLPQIVQGKHYDAVVMLIGANDRQEVRADNFRYAFGTDAWKAAYLAQLDKVIAALKATGSAVFWVSVPPMADADYDAAMRLVSGLQKQKVEQAGFHFIDIRKDFTDEDGAFIDRGPDDTGTVTMLRAHDGVGFYKAGNNKMAALVLAAIKAEAGSVEAPEAGAGPASPAASPPPVATLIPQGAAQPGGGPQTPLFGAMGGDGADVTFNPEVSVASAAGSAGATPLSAVQAMTPAGSAARDLLVNGISAPPPAGRADDYAFPGK